MIFLNMAILYLHPSYSLFRYSTLRMCKIKFLFFIVPSARVL